MHDVLPPPVEEQQQLQQQRRPPRHGFHLKCETCGTRYTIGGVEESARKKQFSKILRQYKLQHRNHKYKLEKSFHAAEINHFFLEQTTRQTVTSATYTDVTGGSIPATYFTTGKKYLISVTAHLDSSVASTAARAQTVHGTTAFADSVFTQIPGGANSSRLVYSYWTVWTAVASEIIKVQISNSTGTNTTGIDQLSITAIKLSDDLAENTDWFVNEVTASTALTTTDSSSNNASVTFTPATASDEWLVLTKARVIPASITTSYGSRLVRSGEASSTGPFTQFEAQSTTLENWIYVMPRVFALGTASNTFTEKSFTLAASNGTRETSGVFALNLSKFRNEADSYDDSSVQDLSATNFATEVRTVSITPSVPGDVWSYGFMTIDMNAAVASFKARLQVDNADQPPTQTTDAYVIMLTADTTDEPHFHIQSIDFLTGGSAHTIDLDGSVATAVAGKGARCKSLFAVTMELAAGVAANYKNEIIQAATNPGGTAIAVATQNFFNWGTTFLAAATTETQKQTKVRTPSGNISKFGARVSANTRSGGTGSDTLVVRRNATNTALSISITNAATGNFSDITDSSGVSDSDLLNYSLNANSGVTGSITFTSMYTLFSRTDDSTKAKSVLLSNTAAGVAYTGASLTHYQNIVGDETVNLTEANIAEFSIRDAVTAKNFGVNISANARTTATTLTVRKSVAATAITASIGSTVTGWVEDVTNAVTFAAADRMDFQQVTGTGTQSMTVQARKIDLLQETSGSNNRDTVGGFQMVPAATSRNSTSYQPAMGYFTPNMTTEANAQIKVLKPLTNVSNLTTTVTANGIASASTLTVRVDGVDQSHTCSITASTTGHFTTASSALTSVALNALLSVKLVTGVGTGSQTVTVKGASMVIASQIAEVIKVATESVDITEANVAVPVVPSNPVIKVVTESVGIAEPTDMGVNVVESHSSHVLHVLSRGSGSATAVSIVPGNTGYHRFGIGAYSGDSTEANRQVKVRTGGTISDIHMKLTVNTLSTAAVTMTLRKNASSTSLVTSAAASTTGDFINTVDTVTLDGAGVANDVDYHVGVAAGGTGAASYIMFSSNLEHETGASKSLTVAVSPFTTLSASTLNQTTFHALVNSSSGSTGETASMRLTIQTPGGVVAKNFGTYVSANARTTAVTFNNRKNAANATLAISIGAAVTGWVEDVANTDTYAQGDTINWSRTTGASSEVMTSQTIKHEFEHTTNPPTTTTYPQNQIMLQETTDTGKNMLQGTTYYPPLAGSYGSLPPTATGAEVRVPTTEPLWLIHRLQVYVAQHIILGPPTSIYVQKNDADTDLRLSILSRATGNFVNTAASVQTTSAEDTLNYKVAVGADPTTAGALFTFTNLSVVQNAGKYILVVKPGVTGEFVKVLPTEPVDITESIKKKRNYPTNHALQIAANVGSTIAMAVAGTRYLRFGTGGADVSTVEAERTVRVRTGGTVSDYYVNVITNTVTASSSFTLKKNGTNTSLALSVGSSATGSFSNTTDTVTLDGAGAANDLTWKFVAGGTGTSLGLNHYSCNLEHTDTANDKSLMVYNTASAVTVSSASTTAGIALPGGSITSTEGDALRFVVRVPGGFVAKDFMGYVTSNARTTSTTFVMRKSGVDGAGTFSVGAATTGIFEDTVNTVTYAVGDRFSCNRTTGTGSEVMTVGFLKSEVEQASGGADGATPTHQIIVGDSSGKTFSANTDYYIPLGGSLSGIPSGSSTNQVTPTIQPLMRMHSLETHWTASGPTTTSTFTVQVNGANTPLSLSIPAPSLAGAFLSAPGAEAHTSKTTDTVMYKAEMGAGSSAGVSRLSLVFESGTPGYDRIRHAFSNVRLEEPNFLSNPGFESGTSSPDNWVLDSNPAAGNITWSTADARTGTHSIHIDMATQDLANSKYGYLESQYIAVTGSTPYHLSAYVKGTVSTATLEGGFVPYTGFYVSWWNDQPSNNHEGSSVVKQWALTTDTDTYAGWTLLSASFEPPEGATKGRIEWYSERPVDLFIDDIVFGPAGQEYVNVTENITKLVTTGGGGAFVKLAPEDVGITEAANLIRGRIQQLVESIGITEAVSRIIGRTVKVDEAIGITENLARLGVLSRVVNEPVGTTEAINYLKAMTRIVNESVDITETVNRLKALTRVATTEDVGITESVSRALGKTLSVNEAVGVTEAINKLTGRVKVVDESVELAESINRLKAATRIIDESIGVTEAANFSRVLVRAVNEQVDIAETITRLKALVREVSEGVDIAENIVKLIGLVRVVTPSETVDITEAVEAILAAAPQVVKQVDEAVGVTEAVNYLAAKVRIVDEAVSITEAVNYIRSLTRIVNESTDITETINRVTGLTRQVSETVDIAEAISKVTGIVKVVGGYPIVLPGDYVGADFVTADFVAGATFTEETVGITEAVNKILAQPPPNVQVAPTELVDIAEAVNYLLSKVRIIDEAIDISESVNRLSARIRAVNESISIGEAHNIARNLIRIQNEQVDVTETINRMSALSRVVNESMDILEDVQRNVSLIRVANETMDLVESIQAALIKIRRVDEQVDITELVQAITAVGGVDVKKVVDTETINISEALNVILGRVKVVTETVDISEAPPIRLLGLSRAVNESVGLTESLNKLASIVREVNEQVHITEFTQKVQALIKAISETVNISEAAQYVKGLTRIVNEAVSLSESQFSAKGKAIIVSEIVQITENIISLLEFQAFIPTQPLSGTMALGTNAAHRRRKYSRFPTFRKLQYKPVRLYQQSPMQIEDYRNKPKPEAKPKIDKEHLNIKREVIAKLTIRYNIGNVLSAEQLAAKALVNQLKQGIRYTHDETIHEAAYTQRYNVPTIKAKGESIQEATKTKKRNDIILIKDVVSASLNYSYNVTDSNEYLEAVEMRDFLEIVTANTELLLMDQEDEYDEEERYG